jgi:hypothetical protein
MSTAPTPHFINLGTTPPAQCPGTAANPQAAPGHLCLYEDFNSNRSVVHVFNENGSYEAASRWGAGLWEIPTTASSGSFSYGTWAATSPSGAAPATTRPTSVAGQ